MENQHAKITGYRDLSQEEIDLMNEIKQKAAECGEIVNRLRAFGMDAPDSKSPLDQRWVAIGATDLQTGFMALVRSVAKPSTF